MKKSILILAAVFMASSTLFAQFRENNKDGLNVFETPKTEKEFKGVKTTIGGGFTQGFQTLSHSNSAYSSVAATNATLSLTRIRPGFNLASANLMLKTELADGVALNMELYLSARHHNETWVKGGFIQFDKLPFLKLDFVDNIMKYTTIKMGQMDVNYGDAHFRRSDGGNTILNPFVENYIVDQFATEIGVEADVNINGFIGVVSLTNGLLKGNISVVDSTFDTSTTPKTLISAGKNNPSLVAKLGYDKQITDAFRARLTGSVYYNAGAVSNTIYWGDRTGSNYFGVIENVAPSTATGWSGRYNPGFSDKVTGLMGNLFLKYNVLDGLAVESFTTIEKMSGRSTVKDITKESPAVRNGSQFATDLVIRFGAEENFYVGARYNKVICEQYLTADLPAVSGVVPAYQSASGAGVTATATPAKVDFAARTKDMYEVSIDRLAFSAGWFITKNVMAKLEYTTQNYNNFVYTDIRSNAKFKGIVAQAVIGF